MTRRQFSFDRILAWSDQPLCVVSGSTIESGNAAFARLVGRSATSLTGMSLDSLLPGGAQWQRLEGDERCALVAVSAREKDAPGNVDEALEALAISSTRRSASCSRATASSSAATSARPTSSAMRAHKT